MFRTFLATTAAALMLSSAGYAGPQLVQKIEVTIALDAIQNPKAAAHWITLPADLNAAILLRLGNQLVDSGARIQIDLSHVELANTFQETLGIADSKLEGTVVVRNGDSDLEMRRYGLTVSFVDAGPFFPEGTDLQALKSDSPEYYRAMVNAFADRVVSNLN